MAPLLRASSLDQFWGCSAWVGNEPHTRVDVDKQWPNAKASREWGTMVHTWKETGIIRHPSKDAHEEKLFALRIKRHKLQPKDLWPTGGWHEVSMAYNWVYGIGVVEFTGRADFRDRFDEEWITGTADYYNESSGTVDDLKTGKWWDKSPLQCVQTTFYTLALYRAGLHTSLSSITHWPKNPAKRPPQVSVDIVTEPMILKFEDKLKKKLSVIGQNQYNPSESNCRFCPNRLVCPEVWNEVQED
jgi:PD-(D/E)XK nuclease superfamily